MPAIASVAAAIAHADLTVLEINSHTLASERVEFPLFQYGDFFQIQFTPSKASGGLVPHDIGDIEQPGPSTGRVLLHRGGVGSVPNRKCR